MAAWGRIIVLMLTSAAVLVGCGGDDGAIPEENAQKLQDRLDEVEQAVPEGRCEGAQESADLLVRQVGDGEDSQLPRDLDPELREALQEGARRLSQLVSEECVSAEDEVEEPPEEPSAEELEPEPPEDEEPEDTEPPEDDPPPDEDEGGGQGEGGGPGGTGNRGGGRGGGEPSGGVAG